jgi:hypothetical protein
MGKGFDLQESFLFVVPAKSILVSPSFPLTFRPYCIKIFNSDTEITCDLFPQHQGRPKGGS